MSQRKTNWEEVAEVMIKDREEEARSAAFAEVCRELDGRLLRPSVKDKVRSAAIEDAISLVRSLMLAGGE